MARVYRFSVLLTEQQCLGYYSGQIKYVLVWADSGEKIQLEAQNFRRFFTHSGLSGRFELTTNDQGKLINLRKIN
jgi:hypothetical protein